jgi:hypothetical protein
VTPSNADPSAAGAGSTEPAVGPDAGRSDSLTPAAIYRRRRETALAAAAAHERRSLAFSWARLTAAAAAAICLLAVLAEARSPPVWAIAGAAVAAAVFVVLAILHGRVLRRLAAERERAAIQEAALARLERDWQRAPLPAAPEPPAGAPAALARDLDLFGRASVFQLLGTAWTPPGRRTLAEWLLAGEAPEGAGCGLPTPAELRSRQEAVADLAARLDPRQELERQARRLRETDPDPEPFLAWCEGGRWSLSRPGWTWASRVLPVPALGGLALAALGAIPWSLAALPLLLNLTFAYALRHRFEAAFAEVELGAGAALAYSRALRTASELAGAAAAPRLSGLAGELTAGGDPAWRWMARLQRRLEIADSRHSSFHVIPQTLALWDLHALRLLDRWRADAGPRARRWLAALGEVEALSALAGLAHDQPGWAIPGIAPAPSLRARALGHPLLADGARVVNDVEIGPPGTFLLVTGSNMAGKSTLLRAIGVNAALALAGGPACAESLVLPPLQLATSMRTDDSLSGGVSRFMAEALRIREVVAAAEAARAAGRPFLYLIDEALAGTNARERQAALRRVLARLLEAGAIGACAGHDLELAETPALAAAARPVHFRETLHPRGEEGPRMTFDYRLRPGLATTSNALELMELLGLGGGDPDLADGGQP